MEKKSLILFLIPIMLIPIAMIIPAIGLGNADNGFSDVEAAKIIPAIGLGNVDNGFSDVQCYGYYGC